MTHSAEFWNPEAFEFADSLNEEIWQRSPQVQREIQSDEELQRVEAIGAQQAMLDANVLAARGPLPWVPDLVGKKWQDENSVIVVGSAYAGFISEYSTRPNTMSLQQYLAARSVEEFQRRFLENVVIDDGSYYSPIQLLCSVVGNASYIALMDLCRVSFVERRGERLERGLVRRSDSSSSSVYAENRAGAALFARYVESQPARKWLWRRLASGNAKCILALGFTAEHGILRLFIDSGMTITERGAPIALRSGGKPWPMRYADDGRKLRHWRDSGTWLTVAGEFDGRKREWFVLPVFHPASFNNQRNDPGYVKSRGNLEKMLSAAAKR